MSTVTVRESLIHPDGLATRDIGYQHTFSIAEAAEALAADKPFVVSQPGGKMIRIDDCCTLSLMLTSMQYLLRIILTK